MGPAQVTIAISMSGESTLSQGMFSGNFLYVQIRFDLHAFTIHITCTFTHSTLIFTNLLASVDFSLSHVIGRSCVIMDVSKCQLEENSGSTEAEAV